MLSALKRSKRWRYLVTSLSCLVVFVTTYALILPVITMTAPPVCELTEHSHTDTCYELTCTETEQAHVHTEDCYVTEARLICMESEPVHEHTDECYALICDGHEHDETCDEDCPDHEHSDECYKLICEENEPELSPASLIEEHEHSDDCYALVCDGHEHDEDCDEDCPDHEHSDECYELICEENGSDLSPALLCEEHEHSDDCFALICEGHEHDEDCDEDCPDHEHGDECYEMICEPHEHDESCFAQSTEHEHIDECYVVESTLVCTKTTEPHEHTDACYTQICGLQEHAHTEVCYEAAGDSSDAGEENADAEAPTDESGTDDADASEESDPDTSGAAEETVTVGSCDALYKDNRPILTGNRAADLLESARSQIGYTEDTEPARYTMYGAYYGDAAMDWDAAFAAWCLRIADIPEPTEKEPGFPRGTDTKDWYTQLREQSLIYLDEKHPQAGDLVFFTKTDDEIEEDADVRIRIGIVKEYRLEEEELAALTMVLGDWDGKVAEVELDVEELELLGWARVPQTEQVSTTVNTPAAYDEPAPGADPLVLGDPAHGGQAGSVASRTIQWLDPSVEGAKWTNFKAGQTIPANAVFRVTVKFDGVKEELLEAHNWLLKYEAEPILTDFKAHGIILNDDDDRVGEFTARHVDNKNEIILDYTAGAQYLKDDPNGLVGSEFYYEGRLDLSQIGGEGGQTINLAGIEIEIPNADDAVAEFASVTLDKQSSGLVKGEDGKYYIEYTLKVTAGEYGSPDVRLLDQVVANNPAYIDGYVGVTGGIQTADGEEGRPLDNGDADGIKGLVYLTNTTPENLKVKPASNPTPNNNGSRMAWVIGDMAPDEVRTLTYRVAVNDSYVGIAHQNDPITNTADLFSKTYERGTKVKEFNPTATAGISKKKTGEPQIVTGEDGRTKYVIEYVVTVTANSSNSYPMSDVKIYDVVNGTEGSQYQSDIRLIPDSIKLYKGNADQATNPATRQELNLNDYTTYTDAQGQERTRDNPRMDSNNRFNVFVGDLNPGESRSVIYKLELDVEKAQEKGGGSVGLFNNVTVHDDETRHNMALNSAGTRDIQSYNSWVEKSSGSQTKSGQTVTFPANAKIYDATQHTPSSQTLPTVSGVSSYTIPAGSYAYSVKINQNGEWDVTAATWQDTIQGSDTAGRRYMQFIEYVRVDVYDKLIDSSTGQAVTSPTIKDTIWVKIDDQWEFAFTGKQIGLDGSDAYVLTYYTEAILPEGVTSYGTINANNRFGLSGTVGNGNGVFINPNISQTVTVSVKEPGVNDPFKSAWYYDAKDKTFDSYHGGDGKGNGAQYWVIKVSGSKIPRNMKFQESTRLQGLNTYLRNSESLLGFYIIDFPTGSDNASSAEEFLTRYPDYAAFKADLDSAESNIHPVPTTYNDAPLYTQKWSGYTDTRYGSNGMHYDLTLSFEQDYTIPSGSALYLLIKTDPVQMPGNGQSVTYYNKCNFRTDAMGNIGNWPSVQASQKIIGPEGSLNKQPGSVYKVENAITSGTWNDYFNSAKFYKITANGKEDAYADAGGNPVDTNGSHNTKDRRDLQNSVVIVGHSVDDAKALYSRYTSGANQGGGNNISDGLGYRVTGDQFLNYAFDNGTYVTWTIQVNQAHNMFGPYTIEDELPDGVELAYVRLYRVSGGYDVSPKPVGNVSKRATEPHDFGDDWTQWTVVSNRYYQQNWMDSMVDYSTNGNQIKIYMPNVQQSRDVTFQIVAKLTGEAERELMLGDIFLNNQATLYDLYDNKVESSGAEVRVVGGNVNKQLLMDGKYNQEEPDKLASTVFPYRLVINSDRHVMIADSDVITLPLVDRMTGNMTADMSTLRIYALPDGVDTEDTTAAGDQYLIYYGGSYSNKARDVGRVWYDPANAGKPVGYLGSSTPINISTRPAVNEAGSPIIGNDGSQMTEIMFENLPDATRLVISYSVSVKLQNGNRLVFDNNAFWEGHEENSGGNTEAVNREYKAAGRLTTSTHGAVHIVKRDSASLTSRLEGAVFSLYRAEYIHHTPGNLFFRNADSTLTEVSQAVIEDKHWNAVYVYLTDAAGNIIGDEEIPAIRDSSNGILLEVLLDNAGGVPEWMDTVKAHSLGYELFHKFLLDENGNLQPCNKGALATGKTDASGNLSYGLPAGKNVGTYTDANGNPLSEDEQAHLDQSNIHFNKVYCIREEIAPTGYQKDSKYYYFVVPNDVMDGTGMNYFYHDTWPDEVHVCVKSEYDELTFMHDAVNTKIQLSVSKDFAGSLSAYRPGTYTFGLWPTKLTSPTKDGMLASASITYTANDFGTYTDADGNEVYGLLPNHIKTVKFQQSLNFGTYYIYELTASGNPIISSGTIAGYSYTPEYSGESITADNEVAFNTDKNEIKVTNRGYSVKLEKNFLNLSGELLPNGLIGSYRFGIWPQSEIGDNGLPTTAPLKTETVKWDYGDTQSSKTVEFTGLSSDITYCIFELDKDNMPIANHATAVLENGKFVVSYSDSSVSPENGKDITVTASNAAFAQLPHTGGMGTEIITYSGFALMCMACLGYIVLHTQRRRKAERH